MSATGDGRSRLRRWRDALRSLFVPAHIPLYSKKVPPPEQDRLDVVRENIRSNQLDAVRKAGASWSGTIASLTSVSAVLALLTARDPINDLTDGYQTVVGVLLVFALLGALIAVLAASRAAIGDLTIRDMSYEALKDVEVYEPLRGAEFVRVSRNWTIASVLAVLVAVLIIWRGPTTASPVKMLYTDGSGQTYCGTLSTTAEGEAVLVVGDDETERSVEITDIQMLKDTSKCPAAGSD